MKSPVFTPFLIPSLPKSTIIVIQLNHYSNPNNGPLETSYFNIKESALKSFIDGTAESSSLNKRDAKRVPSAIMLLANCRLVTNCIFAPR
jgi:hypothetical protein